MCDSNAVDTRLTSTPPSRGASRRCASHRSVKASSADVRVFPWNHTLGSGVLDCWFHRLTPSSSRARLGTKTLAIGWSRHMLGQVPTFKMGGRASGQMSQKANPNSCTSTAELVAPMPVPIKATWHPSRRSTQALNRGPKSRGCGSSKSLERAASNSSLPSSCTTTPASLPNGLQYFSANVASSANPRGYLIHRISEILRAHGPILFQGDFTWPPRLRLAIASRLCPD